MNNIYSYILITFLAISCRNAPRDPATDDATPSMAPIPDDGKPHTDILNLPQIWKSVGATKFHESDDRGQGVKIAVFDNGFLGWEKEVGRTLPIDTQFILPPGSQPAQREHGLIMARLAYSTASGQYAYDPALPHPEMSLFVTNGYENLVFAVEQAIAMKMNIILYSQVWEYGGNLDGKGYINALINKATAAGILWVNAAGNFAQGLYRGPIISNASGDVALPHQGQYVRFKVEEKGSHRITLAWNDFADTFDHVSYQDLDIILENDKKERVAIGARKQNGLKDNPDFRPHAWEMMNVPLEKGTYYIRVKNNSFNFNPRSELRIGVYGPESTKILDGLAANTILSPADNSKVITVGASDTPTSSSGTVAGISKPELKNISLIKLTTGQQITSTSTAAAIRAGYLAALWSSYGDLDRQRVLELLK